jgi:hypothetical protein
MPLLLRKVDLFSKNKRRPGSSHGAEPNPGAVAGEA